MSDKNTLLLTKHYFNCIPVVKDKGIRLGAEARGNFSSVSVYNFNRSSSVSNWIDIKDIQILERLEISVKKNKNILDLKLKIHSCQNFVPFGSRGDICQKIMTRPIKLKTVSFKPKYSMI